MNQKSTMNGFFETENGEETEDSWEISVFGNGSGISEKVRKNLINFF